MTKEKTIFDWLGDITYRKVPWEEQNDRDKKRFGGYMTNRWFSMHPDYLELIAECQPVTSRMENREVYNFFIDLLPQRKFFSKYTKASSGSSDKLVNFVSTKLSIGYLDAVELLDGQSEVNIKNLLSEFAMSDKDIKREFDL